MVPAATTSVALSAWPNSRSAATGQQAATLGGQEGKVGIAPKQPRSQNRYRRGGNQWRPTVLGRLGLDEVGSGWAAPRNCVKLSCDKPLALGAREKLLDGDWTLSVSERSKQAILAVHLQATSRLGGLEVGPEPE